MKTLLTVLAVTLLIPTLSSAAPVVNANLAEPRDIANMDLGCLYGSLKGQKFPTTVYDLPNNERITYNISKCTGGYILGVNMDTGKKWHADIALNGSIAGTDLDGHQWKYDPKTRIYTNLATGRTCPKANVRHVCPS